MNCVEFHHPGRIAKNQAYYYHGEGFARTNENCDCVKCLACAPMTGKRWDEDFWDETLREIVALREK